MSNHPSEIQTLCQRHNFLLAEDVLFGTNNVPNDRMMGLGASNAYIELGHWANHRDRNSPAERRAAEAAMKVRAAIAKRYPEIFAPGRPPGVTRRSAH